VAEPDRPNLPELGGRPRPDVVIEITSASRGGPTRDGKCSSCTGRDRVRDYFLLSTAEEYLEPVDQGFRLRARRNTDRSAKEVGCEQVLGLHRSGRTPDFGFLEPVDGNLVADEEERADRRGGEADAAESSGRSSGGPKPTWPKRWQTAAEAKGGGTRTARADNGGFAGPMLADARAGVRLAAGKSRYLRARELDRSAAEHRMTTPELVPLASTTCPTFGSDADAGTLENGHPREGVGHRLRPTHAGRRTGGDRTAVRVHPQSHRQGASPSGCTRFRPLLDRATGERVSTDGGAAPSTSSAASGRAT